MSRRKRPPGRAAIQGWVVLGEGSGGYAVLAEQPAAPGRSLDSGPAGEAVQGGIGDWRLEVDPAVRSLVVIVLDELPQGPLEVALAPK